jgi:hypothetical protein
MLCISCEDKTHQYYMQRDNNVFYNPKAFNNIYIQAFSAQVHINNESIIMFITKSNYNIDGNFSKGACNKSGIHFDWLT